MPPRPCRCACGGSSVARVASARAYHRLNNAEIKRLLTGRDGPVVADLTRRAIKVETAAKRNLRAAGKIDTGRLLNSVTHEVYATSRGPVARIGSNLDYARHVHDGTGVYGPSGQVIRPRTARALRWPTRGVSSARVSRSTGRTVTTHSQAASGVAFARYVRGSRGVPFLRDALRAATA